MSRYDRLDDLLTRIRYARQRPAWRARLFAGQDAITTMSTLRVLRAVELRQQSGKGASVGDVADYAAVEHSTASRTVSGVVAAGLLQKTSAVGDQRRCELTLTDRGRRELAKLTARRHQMVAETLADWSDTDLDSLITSLDRLAAAFERAAS